MFLSLLSLLRGNKLRLLLGVGGLLAFLAVGFTGYTKGSAKSNIECHQQITESLIRGEQRYEKIKQDNMRLSPSDLDSELSKWMRD